MADFQHIAPVSDFSEGLVRVYTVEGTEVGVVLHEGEFYAFSPRCPHANYLMNYTRIKPGDRIFCSSHGAWFDLKTGAVLGGPTDVDLCTYSVRVDGDDVYVSLNSGSAS